MACVGAPELDPRAHTWPTGGRIPHGARHRAGSPSPAATVPLSPVADMCGIVGARNDWLLARGLHPEAALQAAVRALAWRGPDGCAVLRIGDWWLGCARLAIGPRRSRQPVVRRGARFAGVLNGAITNARAVWAQVRPGMERRPVPANDAWLPVLAVEQGDAALLRRLRGHHAYAVVDRLTGELVFGQDRFGEKPFLCLHGRTANGRSLQAFASTPAALIALGMPAVAQPRRLGDWFRFGFADPLPHRFDASLCLAAVPQRGVPLVTCTAPRRWCREWPATARSRPPAPAAVANALRAEAIASVARCTDTVVPVGLSLSGGIDSSCLAAALHALRRRVPCYQFRATGAPAGERDLAHAVAERFGLPLRPVDGGLEVMDALPRLTALAGLPLGDPSVLAVHAVARAAAADGIRVLLGGDGADELFLGYRRYRALAWLPRLPWLRALRPHWSMRYPARWWRAVVASDAATALLAVTPPAFGVEVLAAPLGRRRSWRDEPPHAAPWAAIADPMLRAQARDLDGYLRCDLLPKVDVATMAAGVEARCPWLEGDFTTADGADRARGKAALRRAFANEVPAAVFRQPKRGFSLPLDRWFRDPSPWLDTAPGGAGSAMRSTCCWPTSCSCAAVSRIPQQARTDRHPARRLPDPRNPASNARSTSS